MICFAPGGPPLGWGVVGGGGVPGLGRKVAGSSFVRRGRASSTTRGRVRHRPGGRRGRGRSTRTDRRPFDPHRVRDRVAPTMTRHRLDRLDRRGARCRPPWVEAPRRSAAGCCSSSDPHTPHTLEVGRARLRVDRARSRSIGGNTGVYLRSKRLDGRSMGQGCGQMKDPPRGVEAGRSWAAGSRSCYPMRFTSYPQAVSTRASAAACRASAGRVSRSR